MKATEVQRLPIFLLAVFLLFGAGWNASAQKAAKPQCPADNNSEQWRMEILGTMEVCLPSYLQRVQIKCFDGGCYRFAGRDIVLDIELHNALGRPSWEKADPSYVEKFIEINGREAWIWHFDVQGLDYNHNSGAKFKITGKQDYDAGILMFSKGTKIREIAETIFLSVKIGNTLKK